MIKKTGKTWVDMDTICLSNDWDFGSKTYASYIGQDVNNAVLSIDKDSEAIDYLIENALDVYNNLNNETLNYRIIGSMLLTNTFKKFNLMDSVMPEHVLTGLSYADSEKLFSINRIDSLINSNSKSVAIYNSNFRGREHEKDSLPKNSPIEYFYNKFVIGEQND
jgi:hypothetical protein